MSETLISCHHLSKAYGKKKVLNEVTLDLKSNRIIGLCGPNGAGKTTLLKILVGLLREYQGSVRYFGESFSPSSLQYTSYLPDCTYFSKNMKGNQAISLFSDLYPDFNHHKMYELLEEFEVDANQKFKQMSKGMQEKFQLALVLSRETKVYLLDEPIGGVDPASREKIIRTILKTYQKGALLIISTHLIAEIEEILDEVIFLRKGHVVVHDNCRSLVEANNMSIDAYFREVFR